MTKVYPFLIVILLVALAFSITGPKSYFALPSSNPSPVTSLTPSPTSALSVLGVMTKSTGCVAISGKPDNACTPGAIDPGVTQENIGETICVRGYTSGVRPPFSVSNKIKTERMQAYSAAGTKADYELDHLISLELGGCPDCVANLWPEPYNDSPGARQKDEVENFLHREVCGRRMSLHDAQEKIATDWESVYVTLPGN
jgi:hypothetical protein